MNKRYSYLALGDSYTIGESVIITESFPYQVVQGLRKKGMDFHAPEIVAKTGWTTGELLAAMKSYRFGSGYDFITLLIGVNNQYRGQDIEVYKNEFKMLVQEAMKLAAGDHKKVVIISIPDWGVTPFAKGKDKQQISKEIDAFNSVNREIAQQYSIKYIGITESTREAINHAELVAADGLHPSPVEYKKWAEKLIEYFASVAF